MPASAYSQYRDPETGQIIWLPQLFPYASSTCAISPEEMQNWIENNPELKTLHDSSMLRNKKMDEIRDRIQKGEQVLTSELPDHVPFTEYLLKNKARLYGENVLVKIFSKLIDLDPDIVWLSYVKEAILSISTQDPGEIHFFTARNILKDKYNIEDSKAFDILAREIVNTLKKISNFKSFKHEVFNKIQIDLKDLENHLTNKHEDILELDEEFILFLKSIGKKGKELSTKVKENSKNVFQEYKNQYYSPDFRRKVWGLWIPPIQADRDYKQFLSPFMIVLTQALWEDQCNQLWNRQSKQVPAITEPITKKIKSILSPHKKNFIEQDETIVCCDKEGNPIITAPVIDANMLAMFKNGVKNLGSLTGHKIVRWQIQAGFDNWSRNNADPRLIEIEGGFSRIGELCKCNSEHDIARIKDILHAQAHGFFKFPDGSQGNMIALRILEKYRNSEPSKISIVLGDILLPNYVFKLPNNARRLIPIGDFPPFYGSKNTYANQAQLQLLFFEEFSNQSDRLAKEGFVIIQEDRLQEMANEAGINPSKIHEIIHHWCQPDLINCFLERQGDQYRLTSYYKQVENFLIYQGGQRLINSERGKKSAAIKKIKLKEKG